MPNAIVQISKFVWVVSSCRGRPTAYVFTMHYELHYQQKKIKLGGARTNWLPSLAVLLFTPTASEIERGLRQLLTTSGPAAGRGIGSTAKCLRKDWMLQGKSDIS
jgi:hypothetical protein